MHAVQLLPVVLVGLQVGGLCAGAVAIGCAEGIVIVHLLHRACGIRHLAYVAQVVPVVVVEGEGVVRRADGGGLAVAAVEKDLVPLAALHDDTTAEEEGGVVGMEDLRLRQLRRLHAHRPVDVRHGGVVLHAQLLSCGAVDILRHVAVGEVGCFSSCCWHGKSIFIITSPLVPYCPKL